MKDSGGSTPSSTQVAVSSLSESVTPGTYTATLKGTLAGTYTLKPQFSGNAIGTLSDTVTLTTGSTPDGTLSSFSVSPKSIVADNTTSSTLTVMLKDANGNVMSSQAGNLSISVKDSGGSTPSSTQVAVSSLSESVTPGTYTATLKGTLAGSYTLKPQFSGNAIGTLSDTVTLTAGSTPDGSKSLFSANPKSIAADDTTTSTLTLQVKDANGNAIGGLSGLTLEVKNSLEATPAEGKVTVSNLSESSTPGTWTATLKGQLADVYTVKPLLNGSALGTLSDTVTLTANSAPDAAKSTFRALPHSIIADNTATSTLLFTAKDTFGNSIRGLNGLSIGVKNSAGAAPASGKVTVSRVTETATPGIYSATLKGILADTYTVTPQLDSSAIGGLSDSVTLTADTTPDVANSTFAASPDSIVADDSAVSTLTLKILDANGNAMTGRDSDLTLTLKDSLDSTPVAGKVTLSNLVESATPGTYTATLKGQLADTYTVTPKLSGSAIGSLSATVTLKAGSTPSGSLSGFKATPTSIAADDMESSSLILTLRDTFGNAISGQGSSLTLELKDSEGNAPTDGGVTVTSLTEIATPGTYTATLKGKVSGDWIIIPKLSGNAIGEISATVTLTSGTVPDGVLSTLTASPTSIIANNTAMSTLTFTAKDENGNDISGIAASLKMSVTDSQNKVPATGKVMVGKVTETATPGVYTAMLKGTLSGVYTVKPTFGNTSIGSLSVTVTLTADTTPDGVQSSFEATPLLVTGNGTDSSTLTFIARDAYGNAIADIAGSLTLEVKNGSGATPDSSKVILSSLKESESTPGTYTATLKGTLAGVFTVKPQFSGSAIGNLSATVTLMTGTPDGVTSTFVANPQTLVADNIEMSTLTLTAKDVNGNAIPGIARTLKISITDEQGLEPAAGKITLGKVSETATPGTYTAMLKGTLAGVYTVKPLFNDTAIGSLSDSVTLTAGVPDTDNTSTFVASPASVVADNTAISTLTLSAKDKYGNTISGLAANLSLSVKNSKGEEPTTGKVTVTNLAEQGSTGVYTATLKGTLADNYIVKPQYNNSDLGTLSADVTLTAGTTADTAKSSFTAAPASAVADNVATSTLTLTIQDEYGNTMTGRTADLTLEVKNSAGTTPAEGKVTLTDLDESSTVPGTYTATLKGQLADTYTVTPKLSGDSIGSLAADVTLIASTTPDGTQSSFIANPDSVAADDSTLSTLTLTVKDVYGNAIAGIASSLALEIKDSTGSVPAAGKVTLSSFTESATPGIYTATLKGQLAGTYTVTPKFDGESIGSLSADVTLTANATPDASLSTFTVVPDSIVADDMTTSTLMLTAKDKYGNAIPGLASNLEMTVKDSQNVEPVSGKVTVSTVTESSTVPGTYIATLRGQLAGIYTVAPQNNGTVIGDLSGRVTLTAGAPDTGSATTFTASPHSVVANGIATSTLTLTVKDKFGNIISGLGDSLTLDVKGSDGQAPDSSKVTLSAMTESGSSGVYTAMLSGTFADTYTVKPMQNGTALGDLSDTVTMTADSTPDGGKTTFVAVPESIVANNVALSTLTLVAKDVNGNAISGIAANLTLDIKNSQNQSPVEGKVTLTALTESTSVPGTYTATLKGMLVGTYTVTPQNNGTAIGDLSAAVTLTAGTTPDGVQSTLVASPTLIIADDTTTSMLTLTAKDTFGNPIPGLAADLALELKDSQGNAPAAGKVTLTDLTESSTAGTYTATLKGQLAGVYTVKALYHDSALGTLNATVTLTAGTTPDGATTTFVASPTSVVADDATTSTLTLTAKDKFGNAISGIAADLTLGIKDSRGAEPAEGKVTLSAVTESGTTGVYTATLKGQLADKYTVTPKFSGSAIGSLSADVTLTAGTTPDGATTTFVASPTSVVADDATTSTLTLTAKDKFGNAISGIAADLTLGIKDSHGAEPAEGKVTLSAVTESGTAGVYTATLKGQLADKYTITPTFSGSTIGNLSADVTLTAGAVDGSVTLFSVSPDSIVADDATTSTLTLTARDKFSNAVTGIAGNLTLDVKNSAGVAPAEGKVTVSTVTESGTVPGTYTATLKGQLVDVYTVTPKLNDSVIKNLSDTALTGTVTLTVGEPAEATSTFSSNPKSVKADNTETSTLTMKLADVFDNPITGLAQTGALMIQVKDSGEKTPKASEYTLSSITEDAVTPGTYTATIKGLIADTLTLKPLYNGEQILSMSDTVEFVPGTFKNVTVNGHTFANNAGFPTTGFDKANFTLNMPDGDVASDYTWTSDQASWATVSAGGVVTFGGGAPESATKTVVILATPKATGLTLKYTFTVTSWFVSSTVMADYNSAEAWCTSNGAILPPIEKLTNASVGGSGSRAVGNLWSEWGNLTTWGWSASWLWSSTSYQGGHNIASPNDGTVYQVGGWTGTAVQECMRPL
ncbi:invasin domain 3-containing protein [Citrobacter sp. S2-9]|uniref:Invasin domain 3-containing protein n=1 Tax=Citrobacter enshiensis TaxID=2971264 RepID=A0ABT8PTL8_9ENTR|nr:invasin domain 3-containing protein [Citrobacter enshiensis]MDN8599682.1 invasin domain 3-containing protein [Citrobacter enshiensis]